MNTNPGAIKVLCYGDSNTWGQKPDKSGRYEANVRWTGKLQDLLGKDYYIVEEGLGGRTTDSEDAKPGRNGASYLVPCLVSHSPLDIVIIMLGTNDLKIRYDRSPEQIANSNSKLVELVQEFGWKRDQENPPHVFLVSPTHINAKAPNFEKFYTDYYDSEAAEKSTQLAELLKNVASDRKCTFIDASTVAKAGEDGLHWDEESHDKFAHLLAEEITRA